MPPIYHYQMILMPKSGIVRDQVQWNFVLDNPGSGDFGIVEAFYLGVHDFLSPTLSGTVTTYKYDISSHLSGSSPAGPPVGSHTLFGPAGTGSPLPSECAVALSYHADYSTIPEHEAGARPRSRYRGRLYMGPLNTTALDHAATTFRPIVSSGITTAAHDAAATLKATGFWGVWSRHDSAVRVVMGGWIDDAFDSQRRRGEDHVARTTF